MKKLAIEKACTYSMCVIMIIALIIFSACSKPISDLPAYQDVEQELNQSNSSGYTVLFIGGSSAGSISATVYVGYSSKGILEAKVTGCALELAPHMIQPGYDRYTYSFLSSGSYATIDNSGYISCKVCVNILCIDTTSKRTMNYDLWWWGYRMPDSSSGILDWNGPY